MRPRLFYLTIVLLTAVTVSAQNAIPQRLDDLLRRAADFRHLLSIGDRVKASELVVASKRKDFLNKPGGSLENVKTVGLDFVDKEHVYVRVSGQTLVATEAGTQVGEPMVQDLWVWEKGAWFYQPDAGAAPSTMFKKMGASDAAELAELQSNFKLLTNMIDAGEMWQGNRKELPVQFQFSGTAGIRIVSKVDTPVTMMDGSTKWMNKDANQFKITVGSDDFDGPFDFPLSFTIYYKSVALDQTIRVKGTVRPIFRYRQDPATVAPDSKEEFRVLLTNNSDEAAEFGSFFTDGKFFVTNYPHHLAPGQEGVITLKRDLINSSTPNTIVSISVDNNLKGSPLCKIRIQ